jgi:hypothetical protein
MAGTWRITGGPLLGLTLQLTQHPSGLVAGTWTLNDDLAGTTDPFQPGQITPAGQVTMRLKVTTGSFVDFNLSGTMDTTGRRVTGNLQGSGFTGNPIILDKQ